MAQLYETPYGKKTGKLLTDAMDLHTMHQNNPAYDAAPELLAAAKRAKRAIEMTPKDKGNPYDKELRAAWNDLHDAIAKTNQRRES